MKIKDNYDFNRTIKFNYQTKPKISIILENPLTKQRVLIENAIVDSGADQCICTENITSGIGHNLNKPLSNFKPVNCSGIVGTIPTYKHSAIIYLVDPVNFKKFRFIKPIKLHINVMKQTQTSRKNQRLFLLGIDSFFEHFMITFITSKTKRSLILVPHKKTIT
jgi:hypothetical protein